MSQKQRWWGGVALFVATLIFYIATLAPTVLWGDDAMFQRMAYEGQLPADGGGHWVWLQLAQLFVHIPVGNIAYRVNLLSAVAGAVTVALLFQVALSLRLSWLASLVTALSLAVSHTFWTHAVRAEVYTVFMVLFVLQLWLWVLWRPDRGWVIMVAGGLFGLTLLGHQMGVLLLPAGAYLLYTRRNWLTRRDWAQVAGIFLLGLLPVGWVIWQQATFSETTIMTAFWRHFTHSGVDFSGSFFDFSIRQLPRDILLWIGFLGLQFVGVAGILASVGVWQGLILGKERDVLWQSFAILYGTVVLFAISYRVNDHFVFFLPSYVVFALWVGWGWQWGVGMLPTKQWSALLLFLLLLLPPLTYSGLTIGLNLLERTPLGVRVLPGREPNAFFLWPAKQATWGAEQYARQVFATVPEGSVILADHTPYQPLRTWQVMEGVRPDVQLVMIQPPDDLRPLLQRFAGIPTYIADNNPQYYQLAGVRVENAGLVYQVFLEE